MEVPFLCQERGQRFELPGRGELQVVEQVDDFLERGVSGEILDLVPHVRQGALRAVDVGQRRRLLNYMQKRNLEGYRQLIKDLGLRR
jgi:hypothetical protein